MGKTIYDMTRDELHNIVLSDIDDLFDMGSVNVIFGEYVSDQFDAYFKDEDTIEVEYMGETAQAPCSMEAGEDEIASAIVDAFAQLYTLNENKRRNMKRIVRLTESDLHRIVKESVRKTINEIGKTDKYQKLLGALQARKVLNADGETSDELFDNQAEEGGNIYNYAKAQRGYLGPDSDELGNTTNPLYKSYASGYLEYLNSHPEEYGRRNERLRKLGYPG